MLRYLLTLLFCLPLGLSFGQSFEVDLGPDQKFCESFFQETLEAEITGGVEPYSYTWTIVENWLNTEDVLSDRFIADPEITAGTYPTPGFPFEELISDWATVRLQVTDSTGAVAQDEMELLVCELYINWEPSYRFIEQGDTLIYSAFADYSCAGNVVSWQTSGCTVIDYPSDNTIEVIVTSLDPSVQVSVNDPIGCGYPQRWVQPTNVLVIPTGLSEAEEDDLVIFPNPSDGECTISNIETGSEISMFNAAGALLLNEKSLGTSHEIDEVLSPGIYFIQISLNGDAKTTKLVVTP